MKYKTIKKLTDDYVKGETSVKIGIVWHFTAGGSRIGAEEQLALKDKVNVARLIDKDGTRYQYLEDEWWAYHTGMGKAIDKISFSVEIVNWGPLKKVDGLFLPWTMKKSQAVPPENVIKVAWFRGYEYFEKLTFEQVESAIELKRDWYSRYKIQWETTHALLNPKKLDYPPDYPQINYIISSYPAGSPPKF